MHNFSYAMFSRYEFVKAPSDEERSTSQLLGPAQEHYSSSYLRVFIWRLIQTN